MIKIGNPVLTYTSVVFQHPVQTGTNRISYAFNHNVGRVPDLGQVYFNLNGSLIGIGNFPLFNSGTSSYFGWQFYSEVSDVNTQWIKLARLEASERDVKVKFFWI